LVEIPKRPEWDETTTPTELEEREKKVYAEWMAGLEEIEKSRPGCLNWFECNLETWRQLWRVCERSDIILYVADSRNPLFHFSRAICDYVTKDLRKPLLMVFSKTDLSDPITLDKWEKYIKENLAVEEIVRFSSFQGFHSPEEKDTAFEAKKKKKSHDELGAERLLLGDELRKQAKRKANKYSSPVGRDHMLEVIREVAKKYYGERLERLEARLYAPENDLVEHEIDVDNLPPDSDDSDSDSDEFNSGDEDEDGARKKPVKSRSKKEKIQRKRQERKEKRKETTIATHRDTIVVGAVGNPNAGKSALINGLALRKIVSVSRTPGHTKIFQTYNLAHDIILCDCPGMVFPALDRPRYMQSLSGLTPLANLRDPFTPLRYVAEHIALEDLYKLYKARHVLAEEQSIKNDDDRIWSPLLIAESLAIKRGYRTGRVGRPDAHRAARDILFDVVDGVVPLYWEPPIPLDKATEMFEGELKTFAERKARAMKVVEEERRMEASQRSRKYEKKDLEVTEKGDGDDKDGDHPTIEGLRVALPGRKPTPDEVAEIEKKDKERKQRMKGLQEEEDAIYENDDDDDDDDDEEEEEEEEEDEEEEEEEDE